MNFAPQPQKRCPVLANGNINSATTALEVLSQTGAAVAKELFEAIEIGERSVRLLGISLSNLDNVKSANPIQLSLFE